MNQESAEMRILDPNVLEGLRAYAKSGAFLKQVIEIFEQHGRTSMEELCAAGLANDWETLKRVAHRLKGSCLNVGAILMAKNLRELEGLAAVNAASEDTHKLLSGLSELLEETCKALKSHL